MKKIMGQRIVHWSGTMALSLASALLPMACLGATEYINSNSPSPLEIAVKDSGTPGVWVDQPNGRTRQYFGEYSWGSIIWLNGTNTSGRYTTGYTGEPTTNSPVSNAKTGSGTTNDPYVITTVADLGSAGVRMIQRFSYINGDRYFTKNWVITNSGATTYTDLRFFHGGDAYFGGVDDARSWWDAVNQMIYLNNNTFTNCGYMGFYANSATPAAGYFGGSFGYGNNQAGTLAQLSNTTDSAYVDAGYYLQWNKSSLAPGQTWTIEAYEYWSLPGSLAVLPPANDYVETNSTVAKVFQVHNLSTNAASTVGLSVTGADWDVSLPGGTNITLAGLAISNVNVNVVVPADAPDGTNKDIVLTAISGASTGIGSCRLTVIIPTFTITPNPLDFGNVTTGTTSDLTVTLSNDVSGSSLTIGTIGEPSAPFSIVADNASGQTVAPGGSCSVTVRFAPTSAVASADSFNWPIVSPIVLSRTIEIQGTGAEPQADGWLAISVTPETGSWSLTAPAGYTGPTSGTGSLAAVSAPTGSYALAWGALSGYVAPDNQTQFVTAASTTLFTGVYTPATGAGWLAIQVTPSSGSWTLSAPAGYTGPTSGTGSLAAVSAITGEYAIANGDLSGYVAPSNQFQSVTAGSTTIFSCVYLQISTNIGTPSGVSATEGTYTNRIRVVWNGVEGATGYEIWRSQTNDTNTAVRIADIPLISLRRLTDDLEGRAQQPVAPFLRMTDGQAVRPYLDGNTYAYDDYAINPINAYYYWVRAKTAALISPMSYVGMGYAAVDPHGASGTADISADDFVYLPVNATNLSPAGTVSFRLANLGPDALSSSAVAFDFHMGTNAASMVWIGSAQSNLTLNSGSETLVILPSADKRGLTVRGDLSGVQQIKVVVRHLSALEDPNLANNTATAAGSVRIKTSGVNSIGRSFNDYDGDGKADLALCATNGSAWKVLLSGTKYTNAVIVEPGQTGWLAVPGDYEGAGKTGVGVYVPAAGFWYVWFPAGGHGEYGYLGGPEFVAAQCDFDGDAKTDPVVYRETDGYWLGGGSSWQYALFYTSLGGTGYQPVPADYDGDGFADPAVYNQATGHWVFSLSAFGYQLVNGTFGCSGWLAVPADYDGDGLTDPAIYAPDAAYWQILISGTLSTSGYYTLWGGAAGDRNGIPVPADYDGDGKADLAAYHQVTGIWEGLLSAYGYQLIWGGFGGAEYLPIKE